MTRHESVSTSQSVAQTVVTSYVPTYLPYFSDLCSLFGYLVCRTVWIYLWACTYMHAHVLPLFHCVWYPVVLIWHVCLSSVLEESGAIDWCGGNQLFVALTNFVEFTKLILQWIKQDNWVVNMVITMEAWAKILPDTFFPNQLKGVVWQHHNKHVQ